MTDRKICAFDGRADRAEEDGKVVGAATCFVGDLGGGVPQSRVPEEVSTHHDGQSAGLKRLRFVLSLRIGRLRRSGGLIGLRQSVDRTPGRQRQGVDDHEDAGEDEGADERKTTAAWETKTRLWCDLGHSVIVSVTSRKGAPYASQRRAMFASAWMS